jgi:anti-sigma-K factor RskA
MTTFPDIHTLTGAYAVDALDDDERELFRLHLAECDACTAEVAEFQATAAEMGVATAEPVPSGLKSAVMAEIDTVRQDAPVRAPAPAPERENWYDRLLAPAAAVLAIAVLGLTGIIAGMNNRIEAIEAQTGRVTDVVAAADAVTVELPAQGGASARVVYSPTRGEGVLLAQGMPATPDDQVYEFWLIDETGPRPAGLFQADERGRVTHVMTGDMSEVGAVAVTIEPAGGSPQPTSDPIMVAEI